MKPRTKLEKRVTGLSGKLSAVTEVQKEWAKEHIFTHEAYRCKDCLLYTSFCTISVWDADKGVWVNKQDVGTESNTEKEKGQASDAFKRAAFNWGIGRELYTAPFIWITLDSSEVYEKTGYNGSKSFGTNTKFNVQSIEYNQQREISKLVIVDGRGDVRYVFGEVKEKVKEQAPARTVPKNPAQTPAAFTGAQLKQAVDEMNACKSRAQVLSVWKRYTVMQNNNEFRNACIEMGKKYPEKK